LEKELLNGCRDAVSIMITALRRKLGEDLVSVVLFGSFARGDASRESDIDLLIVGDNLPQSRFDRIRLFDEVERSIEKELKKIEEEYGVTISFSPIIKSVEEARRFTPLYLDLVEDAVILYDKNNFMENILEKLRRRLRELGAVRVWRGRRWYWILKPEIKVGEVVEIE